MNLAFARRIAEIYRPGDLIWVHDYHLLLLPRLLRDQIGGLKGADAVVGLFVHTPFPSSEVFRCLPSQYTPLFFVLSSNGRSTLLLRTKRDFGWNAWRESCLFPGLYSYGHYEIGDTFNWTRLTHICDTSHRHAFVYAGMNRHHAASITKVTSLLSDIAP